MFAFIGVIVSFFASIGAYRFVWTLTGGSSYRNGSFGFSILSAVIILIVGAFLSWLSNLLLCGFGELVDKVCSIDSTMQTFLSSQPLDSDKNTHS